MTTKHTPGPWRALDNSVVVGSGLTAKTVATANTWWEGGADLAEANARLIAAAPELLDVLRDIIDTGGAYGTAAHLARIDAIARAAIAKAEGRA